ncbi:unnamed protein product [Peronospora destructor]|uniref:Uncharacterized protein n=1 Tax=Peronospora destructor TaxID=86335 RepID=A0AAV0V936_9STRA|nr:unnamed protein product [Peronospora destructor]
MDAGNNDEASDLPTVYDLMQEVTRLQQAVRDIGNDDPSIFGDECEANDSFSAEQTPPCYRQKIRTSSGSSDSFSRSGIYSGRKVATNVGNMSPYKNGGVMAAAVVPKTPPTKRRDSLLFAQCHAPRKSRTSIRTDGGAVFSRLYQPDFYKNREEKFKNMRDRHENFNCSFTPRINRRDSISSLDSIGSSSQTSMMSVKTDVVNVSSRLYDPDYVRKRNTRLQRMRQEREMRECTFRPTINANASATTRKKL